MTDDDGTYDYEGGEGGKAPVPDCHALAPFRLVSAKGLPSPLPYFTYQSSGDARGQLLGWPGGDVKVNGERCRRWFGWLVF